MFILIILFLLSFTNANMEYYFNNQNIMVNKLTFIQYDNQWIFIDYFNQNNISNNSSNNKLKII